MAFCLFQGVLQIWLAPPAGRLVHWQGERAGCMERMWEVCKAHMDSHGFMINFGSYDLNFSWTQPTVQQGVCQENRLPWLPSRQIPRVFAPLWSCQLERPRYKQLLRRAWKRRYQGNETGWDCEVFQIRLDHWSQVNFHFAWMMYQLQ